MYRLNQRLFYQNKILSTLTSAGLASYFGYLIYLTIDCKVWYAHDNYSTAPNILLEVLKLSWLFLLFFLLIGYEFFQQCKKKNMAETLDSTLRQSKTAYRYQFAVMEEIVLIVSVAFFVFVCIASAAFNYLTLQYALLILTSTFLDVFLMCNVGLCLGMALAVTSGTKRLRAYLLIFLLALVTGPFSEELCKIMNELIPLDFYKLYYLFAIGPPNLQWVENESFVTSVLPYRFFSVFFWIFLSGVVVALSTRARRKSKRRFRAGVASLAALTAVCAIGVLMPQSKYVLNTDPNEFTSADSNYYGDQFDNGQFDPPAAPAEAFHILAYDMAFSAVVNLSAEVTMTTDRADLAAYAFTLHHGYRLRSVADQDGNDLPFTQEGDYITVTGNGSVQKLTMRYKGHCPAQYANIQGLNLPGDFAYYPRAGFQALYAIDEYEEDSHRYRTGYPLSTVVDDETQFNVRFSYGNTVYSNLESDEKNRFSGTSNGVTLVSGLYTETTWGSFTAVVPYLDRLCFDSPYVDTITESLETLANEIEEPDFLEAFPQGVPTLRGRKIMVLPPLSPRLNSSVLLTDHILGGRGPWGFAVEDGRQALLLELLQENA